MKRYLETFFRYWLLLVVPVIALPFGEYVLTRHPAPAVFASANIYVEQSVVDQAANSNQWNTAAQNEADSMNQWLKSPSFDLQVANGSPVYARRLKAIPNPLASVYNDFTKNIGITADGSSLVAISYTTSDWTMSIEVINSLIAVYRNLSLSLTHQTASDSIKYYQFQLQNALQQERQSAAQLAAYIQQHSIKGDQLVWGQAGDPTLAALTDKNKADQQAVSDLQQKIQDASVASNYSSNAQASNSIRIMDPPSVSWVTSTRKRLTNVGIAGGVGLLLAIVCLVLLTSQDRSLHYAEEAETLLGLPVLATVAYDPALALRKTGEVRQSPNAKPVKPLLDRINKQGTAGPSSSAVNE